MTAASALLKTVRLRVDRRRGIGVGRRRVVREAAHFIAAEQGHGSGANGDLGVRRHAGGGGLVLETSGIHPQATVPMRQLRRLLRHHQPITHPVVGTSRRRTLQNEDRGKQLRRPPWLDHGNGFQRRRDVRTRSR